jgi:[1-hydroxy-2-(trimethylamino)ethyl]phosphonate dioxygenase
MGVIESVIRLFSERGQDAYFGEAVTQAEHALQTAHLAQKSGAANELIAAALLHDVGHLLHGLPEDVAEQGIDARHEYVGAGWLARHFIPAVAGPVWLHVAAKRYLCAVDPDYTSGLSSASRASLKLQGGPFTPEEVAHFQQHPFWKAAVALRRWDDSAKVPGLVVPGLQHYRPCLEAVLAEANG